MLSSLYVFNVLQIFGFLLIILFLTYILFFNIKNVYSIIVGIIYDTILNIQSILKILFLIFIVLSVLSLLIDIIYNLSYIIVDTNPFDLISYMSSSSGSNPVVNSNSVQDPIRWWPSGVPQTWGIIGSSLAIYRFLPLPPRLRAIYALGSMGITIPTMIIFNGIENPNGFNRLMYSFDYRLRTGVWPHPSLVPNVVEDRYIDQVYRERTLQELQINNNNNISNNLPESTSGFQGGASSSGIGNSGTGFSSNYTSDIYLQEMI